VLRLWHDGPAPGAVAIFLGVLSDLIGWAGLKARRGRSFEAEVLFLRRQPARNVERCVESRLIDAATRVSLALLSCLLSGVQRWSWWAPNTVGALSWSARRRKTRGVAEVSGDDVRVAQ